ncbi:hypothetical protein GWR56_09995 [Mucilaginibacter sp. 14171R-50]|nr:hypothetical protein GWR56_09995 [Mucilaginibacter sp. 14171R-50]
MAYKYISFSIAITFISFIVGMVINAILKKTSLYNKLSDLNFIKNDKRNKWIGVGIVRWIVLNTPFKFLNQKLKATERTGLRKLRDEMTSAEIDHLIGFVFVAVFASVKFYKSDWLFGITIMTVNAVMNLYPSLLQQQNKRKIDRVLKYFGDHTAR